MSTLHNAVSWHREFDGREAHELRDLAVDILVMDSSKGGTYDTMYNPAEIRALKLKPNGARRWVIAAIPFTYVSPDHYYWRSGWQTGYPAFIKDRFANGDNKYAVDCTIPAYTEFMKELTNHVLTLGYDGVYLEGCCPAPLDMYAATAVMRAVRIHGTARHAQFVMIADNAEWFDEAPEDLIDGCVSRDLLSQAKFSKDMNTWLATGKVVLDLESAPLEDRGSGPKTTHLLPANILPFFHVE